jgi:hypothetical protein
VFRHDGAQLFQGFAPGGRIGGARSNDASRLHEMSDAVSRKKSNDVRRDARAKHHGFEK